MKKITAILLFFFVFAMNAQVAGNVTNEKGVPLSFVSVYLSKTVTGTTTNDNGDYILKLEKPGNYTLIFQIIGYTTLKKELQITSFPFELDVVLTEENIGLEEIVISTKDNPANSIIRNVIKNKEKNTDAYAKYTAKFYSRGLTRIKEAPESFLGQTLGDFGGGLDSTRSGIIYLSETFSKISFQKNPSKFKEKITASKVSGSDNGISFNRAQDSNIDLYENSLPVFNDLISPIATNAFSYYRYKLVGTFYDTNGKLINKIKLIPKRKADRVFDGFIYIVEDDWALYGADVTATGAQVNIPIINSLQLKQGYNYSKEIDGWVLINQTIDFDISIFGFKPNGRFSYTYSDYNFTPNFTEDTFTNEVLSFEKEATKKDTVFWNKLRPVPLTDAETADYKIKDNLQTIRKSKKYLDSLDTKSNSFGWLDPVTGYTYRNSFEDWSFSYNGPLFQTAFNTVQGLNATAGFRYFKSLNKKGKWWSASVKANYGFSDKKMRPIFTYSKKWDNLSRPSMTISGGIAAVQFNRRVPISTLDNSIRSLVLRQNYLKIYEKQFAEIRYSEEIKNGIYFSSSLEYAERKPLFNTNAYSFAKQRGNEAYTSNNPLASSDVVNAPFSAHKIAIFNIETRFVFGQKFLSYPDRKSNLGSEKYPSLSLNYRKTFAASRKGLQSDVLITNIRQEIKTGTYGDLAYHIRGGLFLKKKDIAFMDNLQAKGNQLTFVTDAQLNNFGLLPYYKFYTNDKYAEAHVDHNFKGAILGRIPLVNKLNFHLIGGVKTLLMADKNPYTEYAVGLGNIGIGKWRLLRIDYVRSNFGGIKKEGFLFRVSLFN
ncbi:hypothetical protein PI23P_03322 [Polaribacter irgensii 23-P]|uniref:Outer membrane protein n=1 Tax=Polaribacter irgensii 23-P TaxID=313594 RepID=A4BX01_9FLAO|nr:DUF5686 and carboxypeptidase regulatory-like domain-containing protein [Polaribacter irgensii]EAR13492.1 hypothetical protein PI23P_03322 [Polaribacter irgensii 23-P]